MENEKTKREIENMVGDLQNKVHARLKAEESCKESRKKTARQIQGLRRNVRHLKTLGGAMAESFIDGLLDALVKENDTREYLRIAKIEQDLAMRMLIRKLS